MHTLDETTAIEGGGWDPRYAVVLRVVTVGDVGAALIDSNGDGGDIDLDLYQRGADGLWVEGSSSGGAGDSGTSWTPEMVTAFGRTEPFGPVRCWYAGHESTVTASADGWWLFVAPTVDEDSWPTTIAGD